MARVNRTRVSTAKTRKKNRSRHYADEDAGRKLKPSEVSAYWLQKSLGFIRSNPGHFVVLNLKKILLFWNSHEFPQIEDYYTWKTLFPVAIPLVSFAVVGPLAAMHIRPSSNSWYAHFYRGTKFLAHPNTLDRAILELSQATQINPRNPEAFNNLGLAYQKKGTLSEATSAFERALRADSTYVEAWYNLAFLRQALEDYPTAMGLYLRVLQLQPYLPRAHFNLGICLC